MKLTYQQKLDALSYRFYQGGTWEPKAGDFYTTSRADLELYQVVSVDEAVVRTRYTEGSDTVSEWPAGEFLTGGFGPRRVFVPQWALASAGQPSQEAMLRSALQASVDVIRDYLAYKHDGDPSVEDARTMGEMDINDYGRDGRLEYALAILTGA